MIVIQNIKTFPSENLNDLIYLVKKYRAKYRLKLNLMLGVQSNSHEDLISKISITTSNFIIVKRFYFPSMKKILLEVIYRLLKSDKTPYIFGPHFLKFIIQNIQVYGMSLEKFRRIIHYLLANHFYLNDYFFTNKLFDDNMSDKEHNSGPIDSERLEEILNELGESKTMEEIESCLDTHNKIQGYTVDDSEATSASDLMESMKSAFRQKHKFQKAYEVLEDFLVSLRKGESQNNIAVFKHCFLLNF